MKYAFGATALAASVCSTCTGISASLLLLLLLLLSQSLSSAAAAAAAAGVGDVSAHGARAAITPILKPGPPKTGSVQIASIRQEEEAPSSLLAKGVPSPPHRAWASLVSPAAGAADASGAAAPVTAMNVAAAVVAVSVQPGSAAG